jgi:hypothetical protein
MARRPAPLVDTLESSPPQRIGHVSLMDRAKNGGARPPNCEVCSVR